MRKKIAMSLDARHAMMIENAFYVVNPPEVQASTRESLPPMHEYIQKLLFHDLSKTNTEKVMHYQIPLSFINRIVPCLKCV